jgi:hypothetical protein
MRNNDRFLSPVNGYPNDFHSPTDNITTRLTG